MWERLVVWKNRVDYRKVKKISHAGYSFGSKQEAMLFDLIKLEEKAGELKLIATQECVYLSDAEILYKPDFTVQMKNGDIIYREQKGFVTPVFNIKKRLWKNYGPGVLEIWKLNSGGLYIDEVVVPKRVEK